MSGTSLVRTLTRHEDARRPGTLDIYCFPPAGGGPVTFAAWARLAPTESRIHAAAYPMGEDGNGVDSAGRTIQQIAATLAGQLTASDQVPGRRGKCVVFFGHSMGALVAFEVIREMRRRGGREPDLFAVAGHAAPERPLRHEPWHELPSDVLWARIAELGGTSDEVLADHELSAVLEPRLRADLAACETYEYRPGRPLMCDMLGFSGTHDAEAPPETVEAWRNHTLGSFRSMVFPAGHFFINSYGAEVIDALMTALPEQTL